MTVEETTLDRLTVFVKFVVLSEAVDGSTHYSSAHQLHRFKPRKLREMLPVRVREPTLYDPSGDVC